jgi:hypothetical protein
MLWRRPKLEISGPRVVPESFSRKDMLASDAPPKTPSGVQSGGPVSWKRPAPSPPSQSGGWVSVSAGRRRDAVAGWPEVPNFRRKRPGAVTVVADWKRQKTLETGTATSSTRATWTRGTSTQSGSKRKAPPIAEAVAPEERMVGESQLQKRRRREALRETLFGDQRRARGDGDPTFLEGRAVKEGTRRRYIAAFEKFRAWAARNHLVLGRSEEMTDVALVDWVEELFFSGGGVEEAEVALASTLWKFPSLRRSGGVSLPRTRRGIAGWRNIHPPKSRKPLPRPVVALICAELAKAGHLRLAIGVWAGMEFYLRPGELLGIRMRDFVGPNPLLGVGGQQLSLLLHPEEGGVPSKTGQFDSSLLLDLARHQVLSERIQDLLNSRPAEELFVGEEYTSASRKFAAAAKKANVDVLSPVLYSLRHAGASGDMHDKLRLLDAVKKRGRWAADGSVRRYEKAGLISREFARLSAHTQARARAAEANIGMVLTGAWHG